MPDPKPKVTDVQVGDLVDVLLHPAGPGSEPYRRQHGHRAELKVYAVDERCECFDGEFYIEDLDALCEWLAIMDGVNGGEQIRDRPVIPDIPLYCIERVVERVTLCGGCGLPSDPTEPHCKRCGYPDGSVMVERGWKPPREEAK